MCVIWRLDNVRPVVGFEIQKRTTEAAHTCNNGRSAPSNPMHEAGRSGRPRAAPTWLMPHRRKRSTMAGILALPREVPCSGAASARWPVSHGGQFRPKQGLQAVPGHDLPRKHSSLRMCWVVCKHGGLGLPWGCSAPAAPVAAAAAPSMQTPGPSPCQAPRPGCAPPTHQHGAALELDAVYRLAAQLHRLGVAVQEAAQAVPDAKDLVLGHAIVVLQQGGSHWGVGQAWLAGACRWVSACCRGFARWSG